MDLSGMMWRMASEAHAHWHAAPVSARQSILRHGLRPGTWASAGEPGVYLYSDPLYAQGFADEEHPMDVWRVNTRGLDLRPDPEDPSIAHYTTEVIPPERLAHEGIWNAEGFTPRQWSDEDYAAQWGDE